MKTINDLRKQLKPLGFNVRTKALSWGTHAEYFRIADHKTVPTIFTHETLAEWKPFLDWRKENRVALQEIRRVTGVIGLV